MDGIVNNHMMLWCMGSLILSFFACLIIKRVQIRKEIQRLDNKRTSLLGISMAQRFKLFHRWVQQERVSKPFREAWKDFYDRYQQNIRGGLLEEVPDLHDYFIEEDFVQLRTHHRFFELLPGIFLSLGILGTFLSLVYATQDISTTGSAAQLNSNIQQLLSGMNVAFWSSIVGICCSLITQICNRVFYRKWLIRQFLIMVHVLEEVFPTKETPSHLLQTILEKQKEQTEEMKLFLANYLIPQIANVMKYTVESFTSYLEKTDIIKSSIAQQQMEELQAMASMVISSLDGTTSHQLERLVASLQDTVIQQEKVYQEMSQLVKKQSIIQMELENWTTHSKDNSDITYELHQNLMQTYKQIRKEKDQLQQLHNQLTHMHQESAVVEER